MTHSVKHTDRADRKPRRWVRRVKWVAIGIMVLSLVGLLIVKDHIRTLTSLRRVVGTNAYVMDYYLDYHLDKIRANGVDVHDLEGTYIKAMLPDFAVPIANRVKRAYLPKKIEPIPNIVPGHHCSTVTIHSNQGQVYLGRNFDSPNDACLILRVHDRHGLASISVIDLAYLNLNRSDLDKTSLINRLPLLFVPYYLMDGINRHGVAVSSMSVPHADAPIKPGKPAITQATLMRMILDYAKSADDAVELVREFNVHFVEHPEHLMVADESGNSRIIEFIDGEIRVTSPDQRWQVCTNQIMWQKSEQDCDDSCYRYRAGSEAAERLSGAVGLEETKNVIRRISVDNWTMWTSVYDLTNRQVRVLYKARIDTEYRDGLGE